MSHSRKKTAGFYVVKAANKPNKRKVERMAYNRKRRRVNKQRIQKDPEALLIDKHDEVVSLWAMIQDGPYIKDFENQPEHTRK